jgi:hypothetical protein
MNEPVKMLADWKRTITALQNSLNFENRPLRCRLIVNSVSLHWLVNGNERSKVILLFSLFYHGTMNITQKCMF